MGDLPATLLTPLQVPAEMPERLDEEALDVAWLEPLRLNPLHLQAKLLDPGRGHEVVGERAALEKARQVLVIGGAVDLLEQPCLVIAGLFVRVRPAKVRFALRSTGID